jgi:predicted ATPase/DNA-binding winged helix-turn-helix (wHTH) protein
MGSVTEAANSNSINSSNRSNDFTFGVNRVNRAARQLLINGEAAKLGARAFDVMLALLDRRDRTVTKNELLEVVWPGLVVEENNLQVHIWTLRKLLGPQAISTIPGRGYRFTAALATAADAAKVAALPAVAPVVAAAEIPATLFGREHDLTALPQSVKAHRLVTVIGTGGIGKTSLAKAVASELRPTFADGTWIVDLAALEEGAQLPAVIARTLNVTLGAGASADALAIALQRQHLLIVLDNCEHVLLPVATLAALLLAAAPKLHVLATSQEPLRLASEHLYRVGALALPAEATLTNARHSGAVRLFEERARQTDMRFTLTEDNIEAVVDICTQLDGVALAIELAAARVALLGVHGVRDRLGQRLSLLSSTSRALSERHRTLRAALQWSHALLSVEQKMVFRRLGVMSGRFSLDAAQQVASDESIDAWAALDHLGALVEKSLVAAECDSRGDMSYRMLETMRHFSLECIAESGEEHATRERHLAFFLALAEQAEASLAGPQQGAWLDRLTIDRDNLLAALAWCEHGVNGAERGLRITIALERFWLSRGMMAQGHLACVAALALPGAEQHAKLCCHALVLSGHMLSYRGLDAEAIVQFQKSVALARSGGFMELLTRGLSRLGYAHLSRRDLKTARACLEEAYALSSPLSTESSLTNIAANMLAELERLEGNIDAARALYERGLRIARAEGDRLSTMIGLNNLSMIAVMQHDHSRARAMLLESLAISDELRSRRGRLVVMEVCAGLAASLGLWSLTPRFDGAADIHTVQMGRRRDLPDVEFLAPLVDRAKHALGRSDYEAAINAGRALSYDEAVAEMLQWLRTVV